MDTDSRYWKFSFIAYSEVLRRGWSGDWDLNNPGIILPKKVSSSIEESSTAKQVSPLLSGAINLFNDLSKIDKYGETVLLILTSHEIIYLLSLILEKF